MSVSKMINPNNPPRNSPTPWGKAHAESRYQKRQEDKRQEKSKSE